MDKETLERLNYFQQNYDCIAHYPLKNGKIYLGDIKRKQCRFCGRSYPEVTFRKTAHAIPELIGNNTLFSNYECDKCNIFFSETIEDNFAKFLGPGRTATGVRGKKGIPSYKAENFRIDVDASSKTITFADDFSNPNIKEDDQSKKILFKAIKQPYVPILAYKCLVKMALSIMPEEELMSFTWALNWIMERDITKSRYKIDPLKVFYVFIPGPMPYRYISNYLFRKKKSIENVPYLIYIVRFNNFLFQIFLPNFHSSSFISEQVNVGWFPVSQRYRQQYGDPSYHAIDLSSTTIVKKEEVDIALSYDEKTEGNEDEADDTY